MSEVDELAQLCKARYDQSGIRVLEDPGRLGDLSSDLHRGLPAVFVLHAFEKKTQRTSQRDIEIAKARFREMMRDRR
jgi:hypothetical protein